MDATELKRALESHTIALAAHGAKVSQPEVAEPATFAEIDEVEARLGFSIPPRERRVFTEITSGVQWHWQYPRNHNFSDPFSDNPSGELNWSLEGLVDGHHSCQGWVRECFSDPDDPYDAVWHDKLGFAGVGNGDLLAFDLDPGPSGAVVYLSHDDGEGHGYVLADSLNDLLDRWVPLACPGPEDWQWLPFVPYGEGPIDPAGDNGTAWRELLGLSAAPPRTPASTPNDELFDELVAAYRSSGGTPEAQRLVLRALRVCSTERAETVIALLDTHEMYVQEAAARTLGRWRWRPAIEDLKRVALTGSHNGRIAASHALQQMPWDEAKEAREGL